MHIYFAAVLKLQDKGQAGSHLAPIDDGRAYGRAHQAGYQQAKREKAADVHERGTAWRGDDDGEAGVLVKEMAVFLMGFLVKPVGEGGNNGQENSRTVAEEHDEELGFCVAAPGEIGSVRIAHQIKRIRLRAFAEDLAIIGADFRVFLVVCVIHHVSEGDFTVTRAAHTVVFGKGKDSGGRCHPLITQPLIPQRGPCRADMQIEDEAHGSSQNKHKRDGYQAVFHSSRHCTAFGRHFCMANSSH